MNPDRFTLKTREAITAAQSLAEERRHPQVTPEHLLSALLEQDETIVAPLLRKVGADAAGIRRANVTTENPEDTLNALERFGRNLTRAAEDGKLDPVIGRDEEIRRVIQVLSRRTKNNPVLIGEPGVGKTAIVEGLAQRIVAG